MLSVPKLDTLDSGAPGAVEEPDDLLGLPANHNLVMVMVRLVRGGLKNCLFCFLIFPK